MLDLELAEDAPPAAPESFETAAPLPKPGRNGVHVATPAKEPTDPDAENALLACCMLPDDGAQVVRKCEEAGLSPSSFTDHDRPGIFAILQSLARENKPTEAWMVGTEMKARGNDKGAAALAGIKGDSASLVQVAPMIERVKGTAILREVMRSAQLRIEAAAKPGADVDEVLGDLAADAKRAAEYGAAGVADAILARAYDHAKKLPKPDRIYSINGTTVCTPGNLSTIYSQAKTGKSSFLAAMMAATMAKPESGCDCLGVEGPNYARHAVLHFDTEQSPYDWQQLVATTLRRAKLAEPPPWLMSFTIAGMEASKAERFIHSALRLARKRHGGIHSIFIDGIADLVNDPNSADECFPLITRLHAAAIEYQTAIVNILHLNPAAKDKADKGRGHLGSQMERKCESNLTLKKEGEITVLSAEGRQRGRPIPPDKAPAFRWSDDHQMHISCAQPAEEGQTSERKPMGRPSKYRVEDLVGSFPNKGEPPQPLNTIHRKLATVSSISLSALKDLVQRMTSDGLVERTETASGYSFRRAF